MKRIIILIGIIVCAVALQTVFAQETGVITYEVKQNLHRNIPKEREGMKAMVPEFRTTKQQLFYNANESVYKPLIEDEEEDMVASGGGGHMVMRFQQQNEEIYFNPGESRAITSREFNGKQYLIEDSLKVSPWKFGDETKTIMGYECKQAYYSVTEEMNSFRVTGSGPPAPEKRMVTRDITAWYTDKIRLSLGPEKFFSLPGAVLAIDVNNGERVIVATKVELRPLKKTELKAPSKGEPITQSAFRKLVDEQMKRQGGGMIIRN